MADKFKEITTAEIINELTNRLNSPIFSHCRDCSMDSERSFSAHFRLTPTFKQVCKYPLCEKHSISYTPVKKQKVNISLNN